MIKIFSLIKVAVAALLISSSTAQADVIELRADEWCPFNCDPHSDRPGYMVEIAREALAIYGHTVNYDTMNWARSLDYARTGRINGVIGTDEDEAPGFVFGPQLGVYREAAAFRPGETTQINEPEALEGLRVGGIKGYDYSDIIAAYIRDNQENGGLVQLVSGDNALEQNLRKLMAGRVDLVPEEHSVLAYTLSTMSIGAEIEIALDSDIYELSIAFSPSLENSETYAAQLTEGFAQLRAAGRVAEIMAQYGLSE